MGAHQGLNNFPEGSQLLRIQSFGFQSLPSATSSKGLQLSAVGLGGRWVGIRCWTVGPPVGSVVKFFSLLGKRGMFPSSPWAAVLGTLEEPWSCWKELQCKEFCFASSHFSFCPE